MGVGRCKPQSVQLSQGGTNTMRLKIDIFFIEASFIFLRLWVICPKLNSQSDNFFDFNPVLPLSGKCPPSPKYWAFLSDFSWKWNVLLLSTLLYIYFFNLGSENGCCAKTTWVSCIYDKSTYVNKNASQTLLLNVYAKRFRKLDG